LVKENELENYKLYKEFPRGKISDIPQKIVQVNSLARLNIIAEVFYFYAYNENGSIVKNYLTLYPFIKKKIRTFARNKI